MTGRLRALALRCGAWPARPVVWGLAALFSAWVVLDVLVLRVSGGLALSTYDAMVRARLVAAAPDPRIVIVDIDEASLARMGREFGRWPWPRDTLATVLDYLERQQPAAIAWDMVFSDADALSPGGDAAFDAAVRRSAHSHFSVVRLPPANDGASQITRAALPGLWAPAAAGVAGAPPATVALIPPVLPAVAAARLGYNNGYVDRDGVLRRYRHAERLADGSVIRSLPLSVLNAIDPVAASAFQQRAADHLGSLDELIAWRHQAHVYPRVSFADLFAVADGGQAPAALPAFAGKVVLIGASAPSLHDVHPTPMSAMQDGVETMATVIDNALNGRRIGELPRWLQAALAIALCLGIAWWARRRSVASLAPALVTLPAALLALSYLSLNAGPLFLDLNLAAGLALAFLALLRLWNTWRRNHWCTAPAGAAPLAVWPWLRDGPWVDAALDRLIDAVERHAPQCRLMVVDANYLWPARLRWPELARCAAIVGSIEALQAARPALARAIGPLARRCGEPVPAGAAPGREQLAATAFRAWSALQDADDPRSERASP
jgi:CHASE2 domain-containing sensor protein